MCHTVGPDGKVLEIGFKICLDHRIDMKFCTQTEFEITNPIRKIDVIAQLDGSSKRPAFT